MSRKLTLSVVSVVALSFVLTTSDVQAEGRVANMRARVVQKAKNVRAKVGKWWNALPSVQLFKAGKAQRAKGLEHGKASDKAVKSTRRGLRTIIGTAFLGWKNAKHKKSAKKNARKALKAQGQYQKDTVVGDAKMALAAVAAPFDVATEGIEAGAKAVERGAVATARGVKNAGVATLGAVLYAGDYTAQKAVEAKNYTVKKAGEAKQAVVETTTAAYQRGEATVARAERKAQDAVAGGLSRMAERINDGAKAVAKETPLQKTVNGRTSRVAKRRADLKAYVEGRALGMSDAKLAKVFGVSASTIAKDRKALGMGTAKQRLATQKK